MPPHEPRRVRFAPSPTGSLHLGNARTALFNWIVARQGGGSMVLRIEDTDVEREREGSEAGILRDLEWLGLDWSEGPDVGGPHGPYRQSERRDLYESAARGLIERGRAYRCFCDEDTLARDRERRLAEGRAPHYPGTCRGLSPEEASRRAAAGEASVVRFLADPDGGAAGEGQVVFADRLRGTVAFPLKEIGDTVILRRDGRPTYNFAVVVDDDAMAIDLVLRGEDHLSNTPRQMLIYRALGRRPPEFAHLPMVRALDGSRLSKRHGAVSVADYRERGYPVEGLVNALALLGWSPGEDRALVGRDELIGTFDLDQVGRSPAAFDPSRLDWICSQHLLQTPGEQLVEPFHRRLALAGTLPEELPDPARAWMASVCDLLKRYVSHDAEVPVQAAPLFWAATAPPPADALAEIGDAVSRSVLSALTEHGAARPALDLGSWKELQGAVGRQAGAKGKALFRPLRVGLTGRPSGPELDVLVPLIEQGHVLFPEHVASVETRARRTLRWLGGA